MPTVPVVFRWVNSVPVFSDIPIPVGTFNGWSFSYAYKTADGTDVQDSWYRSVEGDTLPVTYSANPATMFPTNVDKAKAYTKSYPSTLTYPDEWKEVFIEIIIRTGAQIGYVARYVMGNIDGECEQDARDSDAAITEEPLGVEFDIAVNAFGESGTPNLFANYGVDDITYTGSVVLDYGDGDSETVPFSITLPGASVSSYMVDFVNEFDNDGSDYTRIPLLQFRADETIVGLPSLVVVTDTATDYVAEYRMPRFRHEYEDADNDRATATIDTDYGGTHGFKYQVFPVAAIQGESENGDLLLDGSNSFHIYNEDIVEYAWSFREAGSVGGFGLPHVDSSPTYEIELDSGDWEVRLVVTSQPGMDTTQQKESAPRIRTLSVEDSHISATSDHDGVGYVAMKDGSDLQTKQYVDGYASQVLKAALPNHDSPTLYQLPGSSRFYLSARNKATGSFTLYYSDDFCDSFEVLT